MFAASSRPRLLVFALSGVLALVVGFFAVAPPRAERLIVAVGYYYILGVFSLFVFYAWRVAEPRRAVWMSWLRSPGWVGLSLLGGSIFAVWADPFQHKILYDEYVLQGTAWHM